MESRACPGAPIRKRVEIVGAKGGYLPVRKVQGRNAGERKKLEGRRQRGKILCMIREEKGFIAGWRMSIQEGLQGNYLKEGKEFKAGPYWGCR